MNFSKLAISTLIISSAFVACSEEITENTVDTPYSANTSNIKNAGQAVDLGLPSGTKWANMNIGATSEADNGILFVWGDITGTKLLANTVTSYKDVTTLTAASDLFELYKGEEKTGTICDTTNVLKIAEAKLIDLSFIGDTTKLDSAARAAIDFQKIEKIHSFLKAQLNDVMSKGNKGFLEATLTNMDFELVYDWDGTQFIERIPNLTELFKIQDAKGNKLPPTTQDTLNYYQKFKYEQLTNLVVDVIRSTEVKFFDSRLANNWDNNYTKITDQFGYERRRDYSGADLGNAPKDRHDDKKKNNLNFIPAYSIISDASHDPATYNWGANWQMPTTEQFVELLAECNWEFTGNGYKVSSKKNNSFIFLPAAGYRYGDKQYGNGNAGYYATGEIIGTYHFPSMAEQVKGSKGAINGTENMPDMLIFQHGQYNSLDIYNNLSSSFGVSIRPVTK